MYGSYSFSSSRTFAIRGAGAEGGGGTGGNVDGDGLCLDRGVGGLGALLPGRGGGGGGAAEGAGLDEGLGGSCVGRFSIDFDANPEGFRDVGGGMGGFLPIGGGGFGFVRISLSNECVLVGLKLFFRTDTEGGRGADPGGSGGGATPGLGGGRPFGIDGVLETGAEAFLAVVSGSESYMFTPPPVFLSFGIPPANSPPNCGAASTLPPAAAFPGWSLLLLALFPPAVDGRRPPGTGGAPPTGGPAESLGLSMMGADRSFTTPTFLSLAPFVMSPSKAPRPLTSFAAGLAGKLPGGGGGGGGAPPAMPGIGGGGGGGAGIFAACLLLACLMCSVLSRLPIRAKSSRLLVAWKT